MRTGSVLGWLNDVSEFDNGLPQYRDLPHMGERAGQFAAAVRGPKGEPVKVGPGSFFRRFLDALKPSNAEEVEKLRRMLREVQE